MATDESNHTVKSKRIVVLKSGPAIGDGRYPGRVLRRATIRDSRPRHAL